MIPHDDILTDALLLAPGEEEGAGGAVAAIELDPLSDSWADETTVGGWGLPCWL